MQKKPNIIYLMADELGYFEPGFMGNPNIRTPNLDKLAAEGVRFTNCYAGSAVCAPTRCCFLTGKHSGHTSVRDNDGGTPLRAEEVTIASVLKTQGYATGGFGKWGNGGRGSTGVPEKHGFDVFFGYYDQVHAHSYYTPYLVRNSEEVPLPGNQGGSNGKTYAHYAIFDEAVKFIRENKNKPFFAYMPFTPPHGLFDIPDTDLAWALYKDKPWPEPARRYAAMVTMIDRQVGELMALLKELKLDKNTLFLFSGDNGGNDYFVTKDAPRGVHSANKNPRTGVEFRGIKGQLYEGGLRIPALAWWPGKLARGRTSEHLWYFPDVLPTLAELADATAPKDTDGLSFLPELLGKPQKPHEFLYWEIAGKTAIRQGDWKAVQPGKSAPWELYDLKSDVSEVHNHAEDKPEILARLRALAAQAHTPARVGTYSRTDLHARDRAAKFGNKPVEKNTNWPVPGLLSSKDWKLVRVSSENGDNQKFGRNALDGDPNMLWHTQFTGGVAPPPHELLIDLGAPYTITAFVCLARQDASWNGAIKELEFFVSDSPERLGAPVVKATLTKTKAAQEVKCPPSKGRYVLLRALSELNRSAFVSLAELGIKAEGV
nr:sulfatase-like hydrolase/transferase [Armatimonas sp.]